MRLLATRKSAWAGEISLLAIVETALASGLTLGLAYWRESVLHIVVAAAIAPMLLLVTRRSSLRAHGMYFRLRRPVELIYYLIACFKRDPTGSSSFAIPARLFIGFPVAMVGIRVSSVVGSLFLDRGAPLGHFSANWYRVCLCTDFGISPELISTPIGTERGVDLVYALLNRRTSMSCKSSEVSRFGEPIHIVLYDLVSFANKWPPSVRPSVIYVFMLFMISLAIPVIIYRLSIKSTAVVWLPLLLANKFAKFGTGDFCKEVRAACRADLTWAPVLMALIMIPIFIIKIGMISQGNRFAEWWNGVEVLRFFSFYIQPSSVPPWQWASIVTGALAILTLLLLRQWRTRCEEGLPQDPARCIRVFKAVQFVRVLLLCYTLPCIFYLLVAEVWPHLPPLGSKWFPWQ